MAPWRLSARQRGMTAPPGGWALVASVVAAAAAGVVLVAAPPGAAAATVAAATLARDAVATGDVAAKARLCKRAKEHLLDVDEQVSTLWDPSQFQPTAITPCTVYDVAAVVTALGRMLSFADGKASCCAAAYFTWVLTPLSWMQAPGRPVGNLCIPDTYWANLGWHVANFATGMHQRNLGEEGTYGLPSCRFPDHLLSSLKTEQRNWACVYARLAPGLGRAWAMRFVLPQYTNRVYPRVIAGSAVAADLRGCPAGAAAGVAGSARVAVDTGQAGRAVGTGGSSRTMVTLAALSSPPTAGGNESRWGASAPRTISEEQAARERAETETKKATLTPTARRCGLCPVQYTAINDRWCCARWCDWYSDSMALAVTSRLPSQFGCCIKMNKRCITKIGRAHV